jgi:hypothetical protein
MELRKVAFLENQKLKNKFEKETLEAQKNPWKTTKQGTLKTKTFPWNKSKINNVDIT